MSRPVWLHEVDGGLRIDLYIAPRAARTRVVGEHDGRLKLQVAAPPVDGAANKAVCRALADWLGVSRSDVEIEVGATGRRKAVRIVGVTADDAARRLRGDA